jgi:hypothetical protein
MTMYKRTILILALAASLVGTPASAVTNYRTGTIFDHTSVEGALLIRFDPAVTQVPENCVGGYSNWMLIPESNKAMMAVTLMAIAMGNRVMTVYAKGVGASGYCELVQVDPER